jgi:hypothetical protein
MLGFARHVEKSLRSKATAFGTRNLAELGRSVLRPYWLGFS